MMAKETYYFQHDYNARNDDKILELRAEFGPIAYGIFWMLIETMANNENRGIDQKYITGLSISYGIAKTGLSKIIEFSTTIGLFFEKDGIIFSNRLLNHFEFMESVSNERSESGRRGAEKRWGSNGTAIATNGIIKDNKRKERNRGFEFSADGLKVIFPDKTEQVLGEGQLAELKQGSLNPRDVYRTKVY